MLSPSSLKPVESGWKHHARQIGKGVLVMGLTIGGWLGIRRFLSPEEKTTATADASKAKALAPFRSLDGALVESRDARIPFSSTSTVVSTETSSSTPTRAEILDAVSASHRHSTATPRTTSLSDELGITYHDKDETPIVEVEFDPEEIEVIAGDEFRKEIPGYHVGPNGETIFFGIMTATLEDSSPLPPWIRLEPPATPFVASIISKNPEASGFFF